MFTKLFDWLDHAVKYSYDDDLKRINNTDYNNIVSLFFHHGHGKQNNT